jgi:hypothetical protein
LTKAARTPARLRRENVADAGRRRLHAARHSRLFRPARGDVFNLDLHVSVIADVRVALESRGVALTEWSVSGHTWVFGREREPVAVVNERTVEDFGPRMVDRFQRAYGSYLRSFRGFVATYPPCFSLLYRGMGTPTLAVCATRYEWPFTHDAERWAWLDSSLAQGIDEGWLALTANNRADADYVENYTGLRPVRIPSACSYIEPSYTGRKPAAVVCAATESLAKIVCDTLEQESIPLRTALGQRFTWSQLYDQRAIVLIPYNVSIMALFEHYSACAPIYVPERAFLKQLAAAHPKEVLGSISFSQVTGLPAVAPRQDGAMDLNDLRDEQVVDWYLDRADFYDAEWMPRIRQFESWSHLDHLLATDDHLAISGETALEKPARLAKIAALWDQLDWMTLVAA